MEPLKTYADAGRVDEAGQSFTVYEWSKCYCLPKLICKHVNEFLGVLPHTVLIMLMIKVLLVRLHLCRLVCIYALSSSHPRFTRHFQGLSRSNATKQINCLCPKGCEARPRLGAA